MAKPTVEQLKAALDAAVAVRDAKNQELTAQGHKSKARYELTKIEREAVAEANTAYVKAAHAVVRAGLNKIIREAAPIRRQIKADKKALRWAENATLAASQAA